MGLGTRMGTELGTRMGTSRGGQLAGRLDGLQLAAGQPPVTDNAEKMGKRR